MPRTPWARWTARSHCSRASSPRSQSTWSCAATVRTRLTWTSVRSARQRRAIRWTSLAIGSRSFRWLTIEWRAANGTRRVFWTWASRTVSRSGRTYEGHNDRNSVWGHTGITYLINNLASNTSYLLRVASRNPAGLSDWTTPKEITTQTKEPFGLPPNTNDAPTVYRTGGYPLIASMTFGMLFAVVAPAISSRLERG